MTTRPVKVWCPDDREEPVNEYEYLPDPGDVAERFAEDQYHSEPFDKMTVHVRMSDGTLRIFTVEADPSVDFTAFDVEPPAVASRTGGEGE